LEKDHHLESLLELEKSIAARLAEFNAKRADNQKLNKIFYLTQILLSSLTTISIAINIKLSLLAISIVAVVASTLSSLSGLILSKYMYQERMSSNIKTVCSLYALSFSITMHKKKEQDDKNGRAITLEDVDEFQDEYQKILNTANGDWQKNILKSSAKHKK
jgi:hypothetical protein